MLGAWCRTASSWISLSDACRWLLVATGEVMLVLVRGMGEGASSGAGKPSVVAGGAEDATRQHREGLHGGQLMWRQREVVAYRRCPASQLRACLLGDEREREREIEISR